MDMIAKFRPKVNGVEAVLGAICGQNARKYEYFALFLGYYNGLTIQPPQYAARTRTGASAAKFALEFFYCWK